MNKFERDGGSSANPSVRAAAQLSEELSREVATELRRFNLAVAKPQTLDELSQLSQPLSRLIPELGSYDLASQEGRREFPRTVTSLAIFAGLLRAADALNSSDQANLAGDHRRTRAQSVLFDEWEAYARPQEEASRVNLNDFIALARLFQPIAKDDGAILVTAISLVYGDLCKIPAVTTKIKDAFGGDTADHDIALQQALNPDNLDKCREIFPSLDKLSEEMRRQVQIEVTHGVNLGHIIQAETCAAALGRLKHLAGADQTILRNWLLSSVLDIVGARATADKPESWVGSVLGNRYLLPALLVFEAHLPKLADQGVTEFFDAVLSSISERPFYEAIVKNQSIPDSEKQALFRLARFLSWETDNRPVNVLVDAWKSLDDDKRQQLVNYFMNPGDNHSNPKPIVTYLPYVFTQMYVKHFPLPEALARALVVITGLLERISVFQKENPSSSGVRTYSAQYVWFETLSKITPEKLTSSIIGLNIDPQGGQTPKVVLQ